MARHTFATTITLSNGVPNETVSKLLGHIKIATTQIYARVLERKVSDDMKKLQEEKLKMRFTLINFKNVNVSIIIIRLYKKVLKVVLN